MAKHSPAAPFETPAETIPLDAPAEDGALLRADAAESDARLLREQLSTAHAENVRLRDLLAAGEIARNGDQPRLVIVCRTPNFRRGGVVHPREASYPLNAFSQAQLDAFAREPELQVIPIGGAPIPNALAVHGPGLPFANPTAVPLRLAANEAVRERVDALDRAVRAEAPTEGIEAQALRDTLRQERDGLEVVYPAGHESTVL